MIKALTVVVSILLTTAGYGKTIRVDTSSRYLEVIDIVDGSAIKLAQDLDKMSRESKKDITILINSPGGYIAPGFIFVDAMELAKARGVHIRCVTGVLAASMAFIMLAHCDERYALHNTMLLFHPVSFGADRIRITEVLPSLLETERRERLVGSYLMNRMGLTWRQYHPHNFSETMWTGKGLMDYTSKARFISVVDNVIGVPNLFTYQKKRFGLFGKKNRTKALELIPEKLRKLYK